MFWYAITAPLLESETLMHALSRGYYVYLQTTEKWEFLETTFFVLRSILKKIRVWDSIGAWQSGLLNCCVGYGKVGPILNSTHLKSTQT